MRARCAPEVTEHDSDGVPISALCPMLVAYALAAELYLKSLARAAGGRPPAKSHMISVLFNRLDRSIQADIADAYRSGVSVEGP
ncbi:hypothetical protein [Phenylobacterium sp.]|jgi:HEPN domain-containing protein|uniref:hypothetical protein n=1 Tax=Phenylobacterium sp. TaxID=1871053 RepID=UPI0035692350